MKKLFVIFSLLALLVSIPNYAGSDNELVSCCLKGCG